MIPRVKVCGLTREEDVRLAVELGAAMLGLNFWPKSPRYVSLERGAELARAARRIDPNISIVGLFVNATVEEIAEVDHQVGLDLVQLHGDEPPEFGAGTPWFEEGRLLRAMRTAGVPPREAFAAYAKAWGFLVDVADPVRYGGTGEGWDYGEVTPLLRDGEKGCLATGQPVMIAGGIRASNARRALEESGAWGIDLCSGVEREKGIKDPAEMRLLFTEVTHGQAATATGR